MADTETTDIWQTIKDWAAALWAPFLGLGAFLLYGLWKEERGREKAKMAAQKAKLKKRREAAEEAEERAERRLKDRMKERQERTDALKKLDEDIRRIEEEKTNEADEVDDSSLDDLADRADELANGSGGS